MRKTIAHYFYSCGNELVISVEKRRIHIRDALTLDHPVSPITGRREPHPGDDGECVDWSYEALGLYYDYGMAGTGWDGDC